MIKLKASGTPAELAAFNKLLRVLHVASDVRNLDIDEMFAWGDSQYTNQYIRFEMDVVDVKTGKAFAPDVQRRESRKRRRKGEPRDPSGYVYLLRADNGTYKIGKTVNPKSRKRTFDVKLPFAVEMIHTIKCADMGKLERELHKRYAAKRIRGSEFFALAEADVAVICAMKGE